MILLLKQVILQSRIFPLAKITRPSIGRIGPAIIDTVEGSMCMSEIFDCATKAEEIGRDLRDLQGALVLIRDAQNMEEPEMQAAISVVAKSLGSSIVELSDLERRLYQLE